MADNAGKPFAITGLHTNPSDGHWSYQRVFDENGNYQYCAMADPTHYSPYTAVYC